MGSFYSDGMSRITASPPHPSPLPQGRGNKVTPLPRGEGTGGAEQDKKLKKACQDFEAIFTGFMLKSMRKTVTKTDLFGSSKEEEMFQDMMDDEISKSASKNNSMGIADMLYKQLSGLQIREEGSGIANPGPTVSEGPTYSRGENR